MIIAFIFINILLVLHFLTYIPEHLPCFPVAGSPCPDYDLILANYLIAKDCFLNVLFPIMIFLSLISIILISIAKHKCKAFRFAMLKKRLENSEDLFNLYRSSIKSNETDINCFGSNYS
ncbi:MAG: hypothetical protein JSV62_09910 [Promethearchaeota archaeon]|nr:MAG: hypothetical protein JSV62_09910 [Candidatus Lokiarchaeota archaeon]